MARRRSTKRPWGEPHPELDLDRARGGVPVTEDGPDGRWAVRTVSSRDKTYRCPGCDQVIPVGTAHVVAWPMDSFFGDDAGLAERRHWHTACWRARDRRGPTRRR